MELTVTEALVKLKHLNKKIGDATGNVYVGYASSKGNAGLPAGFKSVEHVKQEIKSRLDSVDGLIRFRDKLKSALVQSNAVTKINLAGNEISVAEAIEKKDSIKYKKELLKKLRDDLKNVEGAVNRNNSTIEQRADDFISKLYASSAATQEERMESRRKWIESNLGYVVTNDELSKKIKELEEEIDFFENNVDTTLSVSNAKTVINVTD